MAEMDTQTTKEATGVGTALATSALCALAFVPFVTQWVAVGGCALGLNRIMSASASHEALNAAPPATPPITSVGKVGGIGK